MIPLRVYAIADGEKDACWWLSLDKACTFRRSYGDQRQVRLMELILVAHGMNDPECSKHFPRSRKFQFQPAGKFDGT